MGEIDESLQGIIHRILKQNGIEECTLIRDPDTEIGQNFMGSIMEATVDSGASTSSIIVKTGIKNRALYESFYGKTAYQIEDYMYRVVIPKFQQFQREKGVKIYPSVAKYYGSHLEELNETFIFENLKKAGFKLWNAKILVDDAHSELVFKELAGYHAVSFAIRDQQPRLWRELVGQKINVPNFFFAHNFLRDMGLKKFRVLEEFLIQQNKHDLLSQLRNFTNDIDTHIARYTEIDEYSIIYHGDIWLNNILFKYEDPNNPDLPTELKLLDWQASRIGHLCTDISYFLYISAAQPVIDKVDYYLKMYYDLFSERLRSLGSDPEKLFPFAVFEKQFAVCNLYTLIVCANLLCAYYMDPEEYGNLNEVAEAGGNIYRFIDCEFKRSEVFKKRMTGIIEHFVERGYI